MRKGYLFLSLALPSILVCEYFLLRDQFPTANFLAARMQVLPGVLLGSAIAAAIVLTVSAVQKLSHRK